MALNLEDMSLREKWNAAHTLIGKLRDSLAGSNGPISDWVIAVTIQNVLEAIDEEEE